MDTGEVQCPGASRPQFEPRFTSWCDMPVHPIPQLEGTRQTRDIISISREQHHKDASASRLSHASSRCPSLSTTSTITLLPFCRFILVDPLADGALLLALLDQPLVVATTAACLMIGTSLRYLGRMATAEIGLLVVTHRYLFLPASLSGLLMGDPDSGLIVGDDEDDRDRRKSIQQLARQR